MHNKCTIYIYYNILPHITINGYRIGGKFFWPQAYARIARIEEESVEIDHGPYQQGPDGCLILALLAPAILGLNHDINIYSWRFPKIWVLHGTPKSSLFIGFSMIFHHKLAGNHGFFYPFLISPPRPTDDMWLFGWRNRPIFKKRPGEQLDDVQFAAELWATLCGSAAVQRGAVNRDCFRSEKICWMRCVGCVERPVQSHGMIKGQADRSSSFLAGTCCELVWDSEMFFVVCSRCSKSGMQIVHECESCSKKSSRF